MKCLYAWWEPTGKCPVQHSATTVTPGMGEWMLLHLLEPTSQDELPKGVIIATEFQKMLYEKAK